MKREVFFGSLGVLEIVIKMEGGRYGNVLGKEEIRRGKRLGRILKDF